MNDQGSISTALDPGLTSNSGAGEFGADVKSSAIARTRSSAPNVFQAPTRGWLPRVGRTTSQSASGADTAVMMSPPSGRDRERAAHPAGRREQQEEPADHAACVQADKKRRRQAQQRGAPGQR
jgi:hypothetical protein